MDKVNFEAKTTWVQDEIVYPVDTNRWEQGIKDCADGINAIIDELPALPYLSTSGGTVNGDIDFNGTRIYTNKIGGNERLDILELIANGYVALGNPARVLLLRGTNVAYQNKYDGVQYKILNELDKGVANGVASLGSDGKVPASQLPDNYDFVVERYSDENGNWYRLYKSGWIEQGGVGKISNSGNTVSFLKSFADTNYTVLGNVRLTYRRDPQGDNGGAILCYPNSSSSFYLTFAARNFSDISSQNYSWYACGQGAE